MSRTEKSAEPEFNRQSLAEQLEGALRREITEGRVAPGERVNVSGYQSSWRVSSTPFRDALRALEMQGFVTIEPRKGVFVAPMNIDTLKEIFDVRIALECMAVELSTARIPQDRAGALVARYQEAMAGDGKAEDLESEDRAVHDLAREYCANPRIQRLLVGQMDLFSWAQNTIIAELPHSFALALPEHLEIAEAYLAHDVEAATRAMRNHLENSRDRLVAMRARALPAEETQ